MCMICLEIDKLSFPEAVDRVYEQKNDLNENHLDDIMFKLLDKAQDWFKKDPNDFIKTCPLEALNKAIEIEDEIISNFNT